MQHLLLNITTMCNARCAFCIVLDVLNKPEHSMSDEEIFSTLESARAQGATEVGYSGGEPSIHKRIVEVVARAKELGYTRQSMNTNGIRFQDPAFCEAIVAAGLDCIDFSIHGHTDELHDREVDRKGAFKAIRRAAENLRALRGKYSFIMSAATVITRHNHMHLKEIVDSLEEMGFENKRLKYAYEGNLSYEQVINEVGPYDEVVPHLLGAIDHLATMRHGFHFTHVPLCLMGDAAVFSYDFTRQPAILAFKDEVLEGDASRHFRQDGDACDACALRHLCTRLDQGYEKYHGRPSGLRPFDSHDDVAALFARAKQRYANARGVIEWTESQYQRNRDVVHTPTVARPRG